MFWHVRGSRPRLLEPRSRMQCHAIGYDTQFPAYAQHGCIAGMLILASTTIIVWPQCSRHISHQQLSARRRHDIHCTDPASRSPYVHPFSPTLREFLFRPPACSGNSTVHQERASNRPINPTLYFPVAFFSVGPTPITTGDTMMEIRS